MSRKAGSAVSEGRFVGVTVAEAATNLRSICRLRAATELAALVLQNGGSRFDCTRHNEGWIILSEIKSPIWLQCLEGFLTIYT